MRTADKFSRVIIISSLVTGLPVEIHGYQGWSQTWSYFTKSTIESGLWCKMSRVKVSRARVQLDVLGKNLEKYYIPIGFHGSNDFDWIQLRAWLNFSYPTLRMWWFTVHTVLQTWFGLTRIIFVRKYSHLAHFCTPQCRLIFLVYFRSTYKPDLLLIQWGLLQAKIGVWVWDSTSLPRHRPLFSKLRNRIITNFFNECNPSQD